jgi:hypothetical protein
LSDEFLALDILFNIFRVELEKQSSLKVSEKAEVARRLIEECREERTKLREQVQLSEEKIQRMADVVKVIKGSLRRRSMPSEIETDTVKIDAHEIWRSPSDSKRQLFSIPEEEDANRSSTKTASLPPLPPPSIPLPAPPPTSPSFRDSISSISSISAIRELEDELFNFTSDVNQDEMQSLPSKHRVLPLKIKVPQNSAHSGPQSAPVSEVEFQMPTGPVSDDELSEPDDMYAYKRSKHFSIQSLGSGSGQDVHDARRRKFLSFNMSKPNKRKGKKPWWFCGISNEEVAEMAHANAIRRTSQ